MKYLIFLLIFFTSPVSYSSLRVEIDTLIDFNKEDSLHLFGEIELINKIVGTELFWELMADYDFGCRNRRIYHSKRSRKALYPKLKKDKLSYSNQDLILLLKSGSDEIGEINDQLINMKLKAKTYTESSNNSVMHGSTNKNTLIITSNRETRIQSTIMGVYACHLLHEYMHVLGFKHKFNSPSKNRAYCKGIDVPLGIQKIASTVLKKM
jgi:hypothetical protein